MVAGENMDIVFMILVTVRVKLKLRAKSLTRSHHVTVIVLYSISHSLPIITSKPFWKQVEVRDITYGSIHYTFSALTHKIVLALTVVLGIKISYSVRCDFLLS